MLQSIALARYPNHFAWQSPAGIVYLIFLATMLVTGAIWLALDYRETKRKGEHNAGFQVRSNR